MMAYLRVGEENSTSIELYYEDHGTSVPVVLIHGFPLSSHCWEKQVSVLLHAGFRVIIYDRRGFGGSSQPAVGYDSETFTRDLHTLVTMLDLRDAVLIGHAMGAGDIVHYLAMYGSERVARAVLIAPTPPYLLKTADNPDGIDGRVFDEAIRAIRADRPAYLSGLVADVYNVHANAVTPGTDAPGTDGARPLRLARHGSQDAVQFSWNVAVNASPKATEDCVIVSLTDYRQDLPTIDVPILIIQGDEDRVLPLQSTGQRLVSLITGAQLEVIVGGPHGIAWTHAEEVNRAVLDFLGR
jgi:non-heme chloroperoxidase